jgi:serine protease Do
VALGAPMKCCVRAISSSFLILAIVAAVATAEQPDQKAPPLWREADQAQNDSELERLSRAYARLSSEARPAIVQIRVTAQASNKAEKADQGQSSWGSGFIIDGQGYILTAQHVVQKATTIEVRLADMQRLSAQLIAADAQVDIALLKIQPDRDLPTLALGDSDKLSVGDLAVVFGYPFGRDSSMSLGIISRPGRSYPDSASYEMVQTDAGANPGNSGGPLLNSKGHVVGMITMASDRGNMGFAVPINVIKRMIPRLINGEKLVWGWLGVRTAEVSLEQAKALGLSPAKGVLVRTVLPGQPAAQSGLLSKDVILAVNGLSVDSPREVRRVIRGIEAGREVQLMILRHGKPIQLSVALGTRSAANEDLGF